jgi:hypothetical protein
MAGPETREVLQCVYAPRSAPLDQATGQPTNDRLPDNQRFESAFARQAILSLSFPSSRSVAQATKNIRGRLSNKNVLIAAAYALYNGGAATAARTLAACSLDEVTAFAKAAVVAQAEAGGQDATAAGGTSQALDPGTTSSLIDTVHAAAAADPIGFLHLERLQPRRVGSADTPRVSHAGWS